MKERSENLVFGILEFIYIMVIITMIAYSAARLRITAQTKPLVTITRETINKPRLSGVLPTVGRFACSVQTRIIPRFAYRSRATECRKVFE